MLNYLNALKTIMQDGIDREGRNGVTRSLFAMQLRWNMQYGFPAVTTKKLAFDAVKGELLWFLSGSGDDNDLKKIMGKERTIWTANAQADYWKDKAEFDGDLGRIYGVQWREWRCEGWYPDKNVYIQTETDQIEDLIRKLKENPFDRRLIVSAWNVGEIDRGLMALPPCHVMFQCYVDNQNRLSLHMIQRSCDMFLGVPFNIASYALLLHMLAQVSGLAAHELIITFNDAHIYEEHFEQVEEQLQRRPKSLPKLYLNPAIKDIDLFTMDDIDLVDYECHPPIKAKMVV